MTEVSRLSVEAVVSTDIDNPPIWERRSTTAGPKARGKPGLMRVRAITFTWTPAKLDIYFRGNQVRGDKSDGPPVNDQVFFGQEGDAEMPSWALSAMKKVVGDFMEIGYACMREWRPKAPQQAAEASLERGLSRVA